MDVSFSRPLRAIILALAATGTFAAPTIWGILPADSLSSAITFPVVVRPHNGHWQWLIWTPGPAGPTATSFVYGKVTDIPVVGDWTGSGSDDPGVVRRDCALSQ